ncbi:MAG: amidohydrolase family protein [Planctomycetes bacterium]|nr:amidohydrolase family protein [Planctomycetota bacterium]
MRIDCHQHFWRYAPDEYGWIDDTMAGLRRDFLPPDLRPLLDATATDGCIAVQARQTSAETRFLLDLAAAAPWILGVVGWVDLRSSDVERELDACGREPRLVGIRHIAQAEAVDFLTGDAFVRGVEALARHRLTYDLLVFPPQLPAAIELVRRLPEQRFVLDHLGKPNLRGGDLAGWTRALRELAAAPNVACKLSGLVTEADWLHWTDATLRPAFEVALGAFGPDRLLFGSDWPVCLCASSYTRWHATVLAWLDGLGPATATAILGGNAPTWYPRIAKP